MRRRLRRNRPPIASAVKSPDKGAQSARSCAYQNSTDSEGGGICRADRLTLQKCLTEFPGGETRGQFGSIAFDDMSDEEIDLEMRFDVFTGAFAIGLLLVALTIVAMNIRFTAILTVAGGGALRFDIMNVFPQPRLRRRLGCRLGRSGSGRGKNRMTNRVFAFNSGPSDLRRGFYSKFLTAWPPPPADGAKTLHCRLSADQKSANMVPITPMPFRSLWK